MTRIAPDSVVGRVLAVALLCLVIAGAACVVVGPLRTYTSDLQDKNDTDRATLARLDGILAYAKSTPSPAATTDVSAYQSDYLQGEQDAIIVAELQNRLRAMAIGRGTELNSANALPSKSVGPHTYLGLRIVLRGHLRDIQHILHTLETSTPILFVERAVLRLDARPMMTGDPALDAVPAMLAELDVYGARAQATAKGQP